MGLMEILPLFRGVYVNHIMMVDAPVAAKYLSSTVEDDDNIFLP